MCLVDVRMMVQRPMTLSYTCTKLQRFTLKGDKDIETFKDIQPY